MKRNSIAVAGAVAALAAAAALAIALSGEADGQPRVQGGTGAADADAAPARPAAAAPHTVHIGTSLPDYPLWYLAQNAPYAIRGNVSDIVKVPAQTDELGVEDVFTDIVISVHEDLFDKYVEKTITVRVQGGETAYGLVVVDGAPDFKLGEEVFVLVAERSQGSIYGDSYYVAGEQHGKYRVDPSGNALSKDPIKSTSYEDLKDAVEQAAKQGGAGG